MRFLPPPKYLGKTPDQHVTRAIRPRCSRASHLCDKARLLWFIPPSPVQWGQLKNSRVCQPNDEAEQFACSRIALLFAGDHRTLTSKLNSGCFEMIGADKAVCGNAPLTANLEDHFGRQGAFPVQDFGGT